MKILVCGDRKWSNIESIRKAIEEVRMQYSNEQSFTIIHGCATGADTLAGEVGKELGLEIMEFPAKWREWEDKPEYQVGEVNGRKYWKLAGVVRNTEMLKAQPEVVLAFYNDISKSKGTLDMIKQANRAGVEVRLYAK